MRRPLFGLALSPLGLGGAPLGNLFAAVGEDDARSTVQAAWDGGVRYFDTAPHYGQGLSERRMGAVLRGLPRDQFVLSTKVGRVMEPDATAPRVINGFVDALKFRPRYDYSRDGALRSLDDSLARLGMDRVDIALIHDIDRFTHGGDQPRRFREAMEGAYPALRALKDAGAIRAFGLGVNEPQVCIDALRHGNFDCLLLAGRYTLLDQSALTELLPLCATRGVGVIVGGPYNSGVLAPVAGEAATYDYRPASPAILARVRRLRKVAKAHGVALAAAALQFPLGHPAVVSVVAGARSAAEVTENLALMRSVIPQAFWQELKHAGLLAVEAPVPAGAVAP